MKTNNPLRGQIWLVNFDPTIGAEIKKTRPALIISNDINNRFAQTVTVIPISDKGEKVYPFEVHLRSKVSGLSKESKLRCQQIRTIDRSRLLKSLGTVTDEEMQEAKNALLIHLGID